MPSCQFILKLIGSFRKFCYVHSRFWKTEFFTKRFWNIYNREHDERFLFEIGNILQVSKLEEWYRVSIKDLHQVEATGFVKKRGGLIKLLQDVYPNHNWEAEKFSSIQKKSSQWWLYKTLQEIFPPDTVILEEFQLKLPFIETEHLMIFDVCIPSLNLIFEYQGYQHYYDHSMFGSVKFCQEKDIQKRVACNWYKLTYLEVPYWWQHDKESIIAIIHQERPDLVPNVFGTPFQYLKH